MCLVLSALISSPITLVMVTNLNTQFLPSKIDYNPKGSFFVLSNSNKRRFVLQYVVRVT